MHACHVTPWHMPWHAVVCHARHRVPWHACNGTPAATSPWLAMGKSWRAMACNGLPCTACHSMSWVACHCMRAMACHAMAGNAMCAVVRCHGIFDDSLGSYRLDPWAYRLDPWTYRLDPCSYRLDPCIYRLGPWTHMSDPWTYCLSLGPPQIICEGTLPPANNLRRHPPPCK